MVKYYRQQKESFAVPLRQSSCLNIIISKKEICENTMGIAYPLLLLKQTYTHKSSKWKY